ncbi:hypothetical protein [Companilactobacillus muriivasis]|uniref:hypothetical protein n=1 Tax=Companilactobacillus muriivasis TaxID=3081444 RepID=UPI0030C7177A
MGANLLAIYSLIEPGVHITSVYLSYRQLYDVPRSLGAEINFWKLREEKNWYRDIEELKKLICPDVKRIYINNLTRTILDRKFLERTILDNLAYFKDWLGKTPKVSCIFFKWCVDIVC